MGTCSGKSTDAIPADVFSRKDVAKHDKQDDCWIILDNLVCDVSQYLKVHPGLLFM